MMRYVESIQKLMDEEEDPFEYEDYHSTQEE